MARSGDEPPAVPATPPPARLRGARSSDLPGVLEIETRSFSRPWSAHAFRQLLEAPRTHFLVAEGHEGEVLGYGVLWWVAEEGEIANVAVHPGERGRGLGGTLLDALLEGAAGEGVERVFLEVRSSNAAAIRLYRSRGFEAVGLRRGYYQAPTEDALVLRVPTRRGREGSGPLPPGSDTLRHPTKGDE